MSRRLALPALLALAAYGALLALCAPPWPDDWDGVGFVESVRQLDLARFQPHPPGYPVYVALLRCAFLVARDPLRACTLVAVASGVLTATLVWRAARRRVGRRAAWVCAILVAVCPLAWRACSGVGSEAPALACVATCVWALACPRRRGSALILGLAASLGVGVRMSWAPVFVGAIVLAPRGARARSWVTAGLSTVAWAAPFVAIVGPSRLKALYEAHFTGHATRWGGTVVTEPGPARLGWLARDVLVDGLGVGTDPLGLVIAALAALAAAYALVGWSAKRWRGWPVAVVLLGPYLLWIGIGQNLRDQPRHALPLAVALAGALALGAGRSRRALGLVGALALALSARTGLDAYARRTVAPPGQQLAMLAGSQPSPERLAVFGVSSVRFFETAFPAADHAPRAFAAGALGDVQVRLARIDALPDRVWVTGELQGLDASPWPLVPIARLCRPPRIDRRAPCLDVLDWRLPYLPTHVAKP